MKKVFLLLMVLLVASSLCFGLTGCEKNETPVAPGTTYAPPTAEPTIDGVSLEFVSYSGGMNDKVDSIKVKWTNSSDTDILISPTGKLDRTNNGLARELGDIKSGDKDVKLASGESLEMEYSVECSGTEIDTTYLIRASYTKSNGSGDESFSAGTSFEK